MIFQRKDGDPEDCLFYRHVSENEKIEIGLYRVLYGYRVRVGHVGDWSYMLDYCYGDNYEQICVGFLIIKGILLRFEEGKVDWAAFPRQNTKPMVNDADCEVALLKMLLTAFEQKTVAPFLRLSRYFNKKNYIPKEEFDKDFDNLRKSMGQKKMDMLDISNTTT